MHRGMLVAAGLLLLLASGAAAGGGAATQENRTVTGTVYPVPAESEDGALNTLQIVADEFDYSQPTDVAFLYTDSGDSYLVGFAGEVSPGRYTISGPGISPDEMDSKFGLLLSTRSSQHDPKQVSLKQLQANTEKYSNQHVVTRAQATAVTFRYDVSGVTSQQSVGSVAPEQGSSELLQPPGRAARRGFFELTSRDRTSLVAARRGGLVTAFAATGSNANGTYSNNQEHFWVNSRSDVSVLVLPKGAPSGFDRRIFYTTAIRPVVTQSVTPAQLHENPEMYEGKVVSVSGDIVGASISTQETLLSVAQCAPESVTVPASPPFCSPVPMDIVVHTGAVVDPAEPTEPVPYVALSNTVQDRAVATERGNYRLVGRVVSADDAVPRSNASVALLVMDRERRGGLELRPSGLEAADRLRGEVRRLLQTQMSMSANDYRERVEAAQATPTPTASPTKTRTTTATATETATSTASPVPGTPSIRVVDVEQFGLDPDIGQETAAQVTLENRGDVRGEYTVTMRISGESGVTKTVSVAPGQQREVTLRVTVEGPPRKAGVRVAGELQQDVTVGNPGVTGGAGGGFGPLAVVMSLLTLAAVSRFTSGNR